MKQKGQNILLNKNGRIKGKADLKQSKKHQEKKR